MNMVDMGSLDVLVIDDEPFIRKLVGRMLFELGIQHITEAENGNAGLNKIRHSRKRFSVIICDLEMPGMDGFEFVRLLRNNKDMLNQGTPVLILTGHSDKENIVDAVNLGIHGFLTKPVSKTILEKRIISAMQSPVIDPKTLGGS